MKQPPKNFKFSDHFLTARYLGASNQYFETAEVYRLQYERTEGSGIEIEDAIGGKLSYDSLADFLHDWDMSNIPDRYKAGNPNFFDI